MEKMKIKTVDGSEVFIQKPPLPNKCPMCHHSIQPVVLSYVSSPMGDRLEVTHYCKNCDRTFITRYKYASASDGYNKYQIAVSEPKYHSKENFGQEISQLSPMFVSTFQQSSEAEAANLDLVAGIGYRKSLEYLIKDYLIFLKPADAEKIKNLFLGNCIQAIGNPTLKGVAERATWLGNDEAHYLRKWEDKDITDLKRLIRLSVNYVENELIASAYITGMQKPGG